MLWKMLRLMGGNACDVHEPMDEYQVSVHSTHEELQVNMTPFRMILEQNNIRPRLRGRHHFILMDDQATDTWKFSEG